MAEIIQTHFYVASEFLDYLRPSNSRWWGERPHWPMCFFRGHGNSAWKLLPSAYRPLGEQNKLTDEILRIQAEVDAKIVKINLFDGSRENIGPAIIREKAIENAVQHFIVMCKAVGLPYPSEPEAFLKRSVIEEMSTNYNDNMALAQHHGMPTSLLDWTENPLVAAYFASEPEDGAKEVCVWVFRDREDSDEFRPCYIHRSRGALNHYLRAQQGVMMSVGNQLEHYHRHQEWVSAEELHANSEITFLEKITLPAIEAPNLKELLFREGISEAHLKPTYDNAAIAALGFLTGNTK